jgi:predicted DNA-binding transcriptional regulator YafY
LRTKRSPSDLSLSDPEDRNTFEAEQGEIADELAISLEPRYEHTRRILRILILLNSNDCTREDIFARMKEDYHIGEDEDQRVLAPSGRVGKMLRRDLQALESVGYEIVTTGKGQATRYHLVKGSGPFSPFLFSQPEIDTLILLHTLFADPAKYAPANAVHPLPAPAPHNPFAEQIVVLVERLAATLPDSQKKYFDRWVRKPFVYLNMDTVTDYLPHRETIDTLVRFISARQQIQFEYGSMQRQQETLHHNEVDPYYIVYQDGHLYLIGYSHQTTSVLEYRIDRIKAGSIQPSPSHKLIDVERQPRPIEFRFWLDKRLVRSGLSQRWLSQTIEREEPYFDDQSKPRSRVLVRATAHSEWRILQQMHRYGDKAELIDPPELREKMQREVERMYRLYQKE